MDIVAGFYMFLSLLSLDFFLLSLVAFFTYAPYRQHKVVGTWKIRHWFGKNAVANTNKKNENVNLLEMKAAFEQQQKYHNGIHRDRILRMTSILVDTSICVTRWNVQYVYLKPTKWNAQWSICSAIYTMLILMGESGEFQQSSMNTVQYVKYSGVSPNDMQTFYQIICHLMFNFPKGCEVYWIRKHEGSWIWMALFS